MKNINLNTKLRFEKKTITSLKLNEQKNILGGKDTIKVMDSLASAE